MDEIVRFSGLPAKTSREVWPFNGPAWQSGEIAPFASPPALRQTSHGAAEWMEAPLAKELGLYDGLGVLFARGKLGVMRYGLGRHSMVIAPSRSGKTVSVVAPNLLAWPGSIFTIDPKGELAHLTADFRQRMGQNVYVLDPCRVSGRPRSRYNPLQWLERSHNFDTDLKSIVQALTPDRGGVASFWNEAPRALLFGIVCYLIATKGERKTLGRVFELLNSSEEEWEDLLDRMRCCDGGSMELNRHARQKARWFLSLHEEHQKYHRGTLQYHLDWLTVKEAREMVEASDFDIREIKEGKATVYVCIPPVDNETYEGFTRLLSTLAIRAMYLWQVVPGSGELPTLLLLDEFATTVGRMGIFEESYTNIAGYGGHYVTILQTIDQLQTLYPSGKGKQSWRTFYDNAGMRLFFNAEGNTADFVSERLHSKTEFVSSPIGASNEHARPLLFPPEVQFPRNNQGNHVPDTVFALVHGFPPIRARKLAYYRDSEFAGTFNPVPVPPQYVPSGPTWWHEAERGSHAGVGESSSSPLERKRKERKTEPPRVSTEDIAKYAELEGWA